MKRFALLFLAFLIIIKIEAQIGIGINPPDPSAMLHVQDNARGILIPRMTVAQKNAINNPAEGLLVYQTDSEKGFWYFTNGQWKSMTALNNGGKNTIYLADDISNAEAAAQIAAEAGLNTQIVRVINCTKLTTLDLSMLTSLTEVYISTDSLLQNINFGNLQSVSAGFYIDKCPVLSSLQLPQLKKLGQSVDATYAVSILNTAITSLSFPLLTKINGGVNINNNPVLTSISAPQLTEQTPSRVAANMTYFYMNTDPALATISFPQLTSAGDIRSDNNSLTSLNMNSLIKAKSFMMSGTLLTSISLPALTSITGRFNFDNNTQVNTISLPALTTVGSNFGIGYNALLTTLNLPVLTTVGEGLGIGFNALLTSIDMPQLTTLGTTGDLSISTNTALSSFSVPNLHSVGTLNFVNNPSISTLSFPALTNMTSFINDNAISGNTNLTSLSFSLLTNFVYFDIFSFAGNKFPSAQVNSILSKLVSITPAFTNRTFDLRQSVATPPTGQGLTDKATLIARPNTVYTN